MGGVFLSPSDSSIATVGWPTWVVARLRRDIPLVFLDIAVTVCAYLGPLVVRFDADVPTYYWRNFVRLIPLIVAIHLVTNAACGLYGQMWRYASVKEAQRVAMAGPIAGTIVVLAWAILGRGPRPLPLSIVAIGSTFAFIGYGALRFQSRLFAFHRRTSGGQRHRVIVVGAGDGAAMLLKDLQRNRSLDLDAVAVVDDDPRKVGLRIGGVPVVGTRANLVELIRRHRVDQVLLAIPSARSELVQHVAAMCEEADVVLRVLPSVRETLGGRVSARDIRDLRIEDLLGRRQVETDLAAVSAMISGRRVLVTGAGGSIGAEISRQVAALRPAELILLDHDETHLYDVSLELPDSTVRPVLADVRDRDAIMRVFATLRPDVVFHAAAHKHVPILEEYPEEALRTNVIGTANVVDAALVTGTERFVLISTDKAIAPASVMGASKWLAEQIVRGAPKNGCRFCAVRFGNVLGSRGSVVPTFFRQIARGGPVTVTDPDMTRYFMSVQEAVQLVLQAGALADGGEVFTLDMGEPIRILDLARRMIRLSGRVPDKDVRIEIVGARPGEKISETVVDPSEERLASTHPSIVVSRPPVPDPAALRHAVWQLESVAAVGDREKLSARLKALAARAVVDGTHVELESAVKL